MEITIQKLSQMAGVTTRTLRHYDAIGLLKPARISTSGYRIYSQKEIDQLQQILFYRELGVGLDQIKTELMKPGFDILSALKQHRLNLIAKKQQIDQLVINVEHTIAMTEGSYSMKNEDKFIGFKQKMIDENEATYGTEIRKKYGDEAMNQSQAHLKGMTKETYDRATQLATDIIETLKDAMLSGEVPESTKAQLAVKLHKEWLMIYVPFYTSEYHRGLGQMYVEDSRFTAYYDQHLEGMAAYLNQAIGIFTDI